MSAGCPLAVRRPASIPVVVGAIFVCNNDDCNLGVILDRVRSVRGIRVVVLDISAQALQRGVPAHLVNCCLGSV